MRLPRRARRADVDYTIPQTFLQLEADFQRQAKGGRKREAGKGRERTQKRAHPPQRATAAQGGRSTPEADDADVDQLASSDDGFHCEDTDTWLIDKADELNRAVLAKGGRAKRVKAPAKGTRKTSGTKKDKLKTLPEEALINILSHLSLASLHTYANLGRWHRYFLLKDAVDPIWERAREADGLPELEEGQWEWYEVGYAALVHGKTCMSCGKQSTRWPDAFLRIRLCKNCRTGRIVRLDRLKKTHPDLHPAAKECVIWTYQSPPDPHHRSKTAYGLLSALNAQDDVLWDLQELDDRDDELFYAAQFAALSSASAGTRSRPLSDDGEERARFDFAPRRGEGEWGKRVGRYVAERRAKCEAVEQEGELLFAALTKLYAAGDTATVGGKKGEERSTARREAIEARVLAMQLNEHWSADDFTGPWLTDKLVNCGAEVIDDAAWATLEPKVVKLLLAAKKRLATALEHAQAARRESLRTEYYAFRKRETTAAGRVWTPLFADFLLFPSVRAVWEPQDALVDAAAVARAQSGMLEDLNEWRVHLRLYTIQLVLGNTLDIPDDEVLDPDADAYDSALYDDDFLELLTSQVMCAIDECYQPAQGKKGSVQYQPAQPTFFGSLPDVLLHQHEAHDFLLPSARELARPADADPQVRIALPLEVSNAVVAMCDAAGLDDETAEAEDLDEVLAREGAWVRWCNSRSGGNSKKERDFRAVLCAIYRRVVKAQRARPPQVLPIPLIQLALGKDA